MNTKLIWGNSSNICKFPVNQVISIQTCNILIKLTVDTLSIFFSLWEVITLKGCFRRPTFIKHFLRHCGVDSPSAGLAVHFPLTLYVHTYIHTHTQNNEFLSLNMTLLWVCIKMHEMHFNWIGKFLLFSWTMLVVLLLIHFPARAANSYYSFRGHTIFFRFQSEKQCRISGYSERFLFWPFVQWLRYIKCTYPIHTYIYSTGKYQYQPAWSGIHNPHLRDTALHLNPPLLIG